MKKTLSIITLILLSACGQANKENISKTQNSVADASQTKVEPESERLNQWLDIKYEEELMLSPMKLTRLGRKERYDEFNDYSEAEVDQKLKWQADSVAELKRSFNYDLLSEDAKISYDLWVYQYEAAKALIPFRTNKYILTQMMGNHTSLPNSVINYHKVDELSDMQAYIKRIDGLSTAISNLLERAKLNAKQGTRPPYFAYDSIIEQSSNLIKGRPFDQSELDSPMFADAKSKIKILLDNNKINTQQVTNLEAEVTLALTSQFQTAYKDLISWFILDKSNVSDEAKGAGALPNGEAFYNAKLQNYTTTNLTADEIHQTGLKEVARILGLMKEIKSSVKFTGSLQEFFAYIKSDVNNQQFYYPNTDEGRQGYIDDSTAYLDYIHKKLPEYFGLLPKANLVVKRVEAFREQAGAPQHYSKGTPDGSRDGVYYAHLLDMSAMPKNEMEAIAYHEGNPGHHMQISIAQELEGVPNFRTQLSFTSYVEGWALYSELLAQEMGAYSSPYSRFGRLVSEMWRAIRLVVDTGIHSKSWTEQQAIDYFRQNSPISEGAILAEVRRYFVLPGQATSYKIGMIKILELREKAKLALGDKFDIKGFHDTILGGGSVPLSILERIVDNWIAKTKG
ncbi:DUF885 domain-containing protein [Paraglaciecola aquimarina]|uniref:DUF885 domain-containing protein n=1 Tax=Paraglaciecola algarum TaxID=3050085 RepID=A0ABS9DBC5_9ALTE|nr:DUF885 domain-containing protein [Paraglaciecola sp. G1-23]MCF2949327.1 DUF885 domain-containing protein [Paraglaciecola sp. G1-23]